MIEIPLTSDPNQSFRIDLDGIAYEFAVKLNSRLGVWGLSIRRNGTPLLEGIAMVGGINMLDQYNITIDNLFTVNLVNTRLDPEVDNFGTDSKLFNLTEEELAGA